MALLSVVLPVFGVAGYLPECLDSILAYPQSDLEVIAVDDASTDGCAGILDEYARRDPRLRVIRLDRNVGLGPARNVGTAAATGDYLWYVDSDDRLAAGAVRAVLRRLAETDPQVLFVDFSRVSVTGVAKRSPLRRQLRPHRTPEVFAAAEVPAVLRPMSTAWSRVFRRDWLLARRLGFPAAWYEDVPFVIPLTAVADRISVLYRVCYHYRQRLHGSITRTLGDDRHFDIFDQYAAAYRMLDALGVTDDTLLRVMYSRMLRHYRVVLGATDRLPSARRREFFARMAVDARRYRPVVPGVVHGTERLKRRMIERDAWVPFSAARMAKDAVGGARRILRRTTTSGRRAVDGVRRTYIAGYYAVQRRLPVDRRLALFSTDRGLGYRCNPAAIYEKARELAPAVRGVWLVSGEHVADLPPRVEYVVAGSARGYRALARARWLVNNADFPDGYVKRPGSTVVQTHHGTPCKTMGVDRPPPAGAPAALTALVERCATWDVSLSTGPFNTAVWQRAYPCPHEVLEVGYPRNDRLVTAGPVEVARARALFGLVPGETAVLFAPTDRDYLPEHPLLRDVDELADALGPGVRVLARAHPGQPPAKTGTGHPRVLDISAHPHVEDAYLAADVLVTDYSSAMFDYALLDRPIVIYAPDWEVFRAVRGVTFDLMARAPGVVVHTLADLAAAFASGEVRGEVAAKARAEFRARFCPSDDGRASERVVRRVFLDESV